MPRMSPAVSSLPPDELSRATGAVSAALEAVETLLSRPDKENGYDRDKGAMVTPTEPNGVKL